VGAGIACDLGNRLACAGMIAGRADPVKRIAGVALGRASTREAAAATGRIHIPIPRNGCAPQ